MSGAKQNQFHKEKVTYTPPPPPRERFITQPTVGLPSHTYRLPACLSFLEISHKYKGVDKFSILGNSVRVILRRVPYPFLLVGKFDFVPVSLCYFLPKNLGSLNPQAPLLANAIVVPYIIKMDFTLL